MWYIPHYIIKESIMGMMRNIDDISVEFLGDHKPLGTPKGESGWRMELNVVSFSHKPYKYDIRVWSPDHKKYDKGIRLTKEEAKDLRDWLNKEDLENDFPKLEDPNIKEIDI